MSPEVGVFLRKNVLLQLHHQQLTWLQFLAWKIERAIQLRRWWQIRIMKMKEEIPHLPPPIIYHQLYQHHSATLQHLSHQLVSSLTIIPYLTVLNTSATPQWLNCQLVPPFIIPHLIVLNSSTTLQWLTVSHQLVPSELYSQPPSWLPPPHHLCMMTQWWHDHDPYLVHKLVLLKERMARLEEKLASTKLQWDDL